MRRVPLFACAGLALIGLAVSGVGRHKPPSALQPIVVVAAPPAPPGVPARAAAEAMTQTPLPTLSSMPDGGDGGRDPPARWAPGAKNYAELGVLPAL